MNEGESRVVRAHIAMRTLCAQLYHIVYCIPNDRSFSSLFADIRHHLVLLDPASNNDIINST